MTETLITLLVTHDKPLPSDVTDVVAQRFYTWALNKGVPVGVSAAISELPKEPGREDK